MKGRLYNLIAGTPARKPRPTILMYHRVANLAHDPWELAVTPEHFAGQLDHLVRCRTPMPLDAFVAALDSGQLPLDAVAVTFDDGYADNYHLALPMLRDRGISATLFLVTGYVGASRAFWWDELTHLILDCRGSVDIRVQIAAIEFRLKWRETNGQPAAWHAADAPGDPRHEAFLNIWRILRGLPERHRQVALAQLRAVLSPVKTGQDRTMTRTELDTLAASGTFTLGAHSQTHPALSALPIAQAMREIGQSKTDCETIVGRPVTGFAYPYGDMNQAVRDCVAHSGFAWACSTEARPLSRVGYDRFALPRFAVRNWDQTRFARMLG